MGRNRLVLGLMRGDEGKGKITDYFAKYHDIVIRYAGSCNAGHTIYRNNKKLILHQIPSGIFDEKICIIGRGCLVDLNKLYNEAKMVEQYFKEIDHEINITDYLKISLGAHLIFPFHIQEDIEREDSGKGNGSTKCGIAPGYRDKYYRSGKRLYDLYNNESLLEKLNISKEIFEFLKPCFCDDEYLINVKYKDQNLLFEGAQGVLLDINNPYYPNVSSSSVGIDGIISGTGINVNTLFNNFEAVGVVKSYMSSVGVGKFLTQINEEDENCKLLRDAGNEYGATTGRPRKVGWFDLPLLKYSIRTSGINALCITRLDTLKDAFKYSFKVCVEYKNIKTGKHIYTANIWKLDEYEPVYREFKMWRSLEDREFKEFLNYIQTNIDIPIKYISNGKNQEDLIVL